MPLPSTDLNRGPHDWESVVLSTEPMCYRREFVTSAPLSWMPVHAEPLRMRTNVEDFRVIRRLYCREWNLLCVNQHPWQRTRGHGEWRRTSIAHSICQFYKPHCWMEKKLFLFHRNMLLQINSNSSVIFFFTGSLLSTVHRSTRIVWSFQTYQPVSKYCWGGGGGKRGICSVVIPPLAIFR